MPSKSSRKRRSRKNKLEAIKTRAAAADVLRREIQLLAAGVYPYCFEGRAIVRAPNGQHFIMGPEGVTAHWYYSYGKNSAWQISWRSLGFGDLRRMREDIEEFGVEALEPKPALRMMAEASYG